MQTTKERFQSLLWTMSLSGNHGGTEHITLSGLNKCSLGMFMRLFVTKRKWIWWQWWIACGCIKWLRKFSTVINKLITIATIWEKDGHNHVAILWLKRWGGVISWSKYFILVCIFTAWLLYSFISFEYFAYIQTL